MPKKGFSLTHKQLAWLCVALLVISLLPLYGIAFFNHPFYDDFGFSLLTRAAWKDTGSLGRVVAAAWRNTVGIRQTWQGAYTPSFISAMQPGIFGEGRYWIATFLLLTSLLLATGFFLWQTLHKILGASPAATVTVGCGAVFLMAQFAPDPAEAFFWYNGGVAYTLMWCLMLVTGIVWLMFHRCCQRGKSRALYALLLPLLALSGGAGYSTLLAFSAGSVLFTGYAFLRRHPKKWAHLAACLLLLACFAFNASAPGNGVRAKTLLGGMSAPMAVAQSFYFGFALMGHWFSLPLMALLVLLAALLFPTLRKSGFSFAHPARVSLLCACLFCAQLTPTLFTGNYLGDGRILDVYYYTYVLMSCFLALYWAGWFLRGQEAKRLEFSIPTPAPEEPARVKGSVLLVAAVLLAAGCLSFRPEGAKSYGPQNMAGGGAALSLLRGEAAAYRREMAERDAALNDSTRPEVVLKPVEAIPKVFMSDVLSSGSLEYVLSLYAEYYGKASVTVEGDAAPSGE